MRFRIVNFRPDRLSGWCTDPERPGESQVLHLMVDGVHAATLVCDGPRPELNAAEFPNRNIGFAAQIGFEHWDGARHHFALVVPGSGAVLRERTLTFPDARVAGGEGRLFGRIATAGPHLVRGWATTGAPGAVPLSATLEIDGQAVARVAADQPLEEVRYLGCGFGFAVPGRFFDDAEHDLRVTVALPDGGRVTLGAFSRFLARDDAPRIAGKVALADGGRIEGTALSPAHPGEPLELVVYLGDSERLRVTTDPAAEGAFAFDLATLGRCDPGTDALEILAEPFGLFLDFVPPDLVARALTATAAPAPGGGWSLRIAAPLPLSRLSGAMLHRPGGAAPLPLDPVPTEDGRAAVAAIGADAGGPNGARLTVGEREVPLRVADAAPRPATPAPDAPPAAAAAPPAARQGLGALRAPADPAVARALAALFGAPHPPGGESAWPEVSGAWRLTPDGRIAGWAADLVRPERPLAVEVRANDATLARLVADAAACPAEAGLPLPAPVGFAADLGPLLPGPGRYRIAAVLEGGIELPASGERFLRWPPRADALPGPAAMLGLPARVLPDPAEAALLIAPPDAALRRALGLALTGAPLDEGHPALAPSVGGTLAALLRGWFWAQDGAGRIEDPGRMPPGEAVLPPLVSVDLTALADRLPLSAEAREAVRHAQTWRGLLRALFSDPRLFAMLLDPEDGRDALILADIRRIGARAPAAETLRLDPGARPGAALPAALRGIEALAVHDETGRRLLAERVGGDDRITARHLWQLRPGPGAQAPGTPWRVLISRGEGRWALARLVWQAAEAEAPVPVIGSLRLRAIEVAGRMARARLAGPDLPETLVLQLEAQRLPLARLPRSDAGGGSAPEGSYAGRLPRPPGAGEHRLAGGEAPGPVWDLRIATSDGPRPGDLPEVLRPAAGGIIAGPPVLSGGQLSGWAVSTAFGVESAQILLVEPEPAADPAAAADAAPTGPPAPIVHASAPARSASAEAVAACGEGFAAAGYTLALPVAVLDGTARRLRLEARAGGVAQVLWSGEIAAGPAFLLAQAQGCATREALHAFLMRIAAAGQHAFVDAYFAAPRAVSPHVLEAAEAFEILVAAILSDAAGPRPARLTRLFSTLWTHAQTISQRQVEFIASALKVVLAAETAGNPARFPHGPLAELAVDLILTLPKAGLPAEIAAQLARAAMTVRRLPLAREIVRAGLAEHPDAPPLLVAGAAVELALGAPAAAEAMARRALDKKPKLNDALLVLGRALALQGRHLEAAAAVSNGRGLTAWLNRAPGYETAKAVAALDWPGVMRAVAQAADRPQLAEDMDRADAVWGAPLPPEALGYTLVFLSEGSPQRQTEALHAALSGTGCAQIARVPGQTMSEIECIGGSALIFRTERMVAPELVAALFAQVRPGEEVVRLVECRLDATGAPAGFDSVGALIRAGALRAFGEVDFETFMARAAQALRVKTILI